MAKIKKAYFCQSCGAQHPQWQGQCNACKTWNTLVEEVIEKETTTPNWSKETKNKRKFTDMLSLQVNLTEYLDWLDNEAYN